MTTINLSLSQAASRFLEQLGDGATEHKKDVSRFISWYGPSRGLSELQGHKVSLYTDTLGNTKEASRKVKSARLFLSFLKKEGLMESNLGVHLRIKRRAGNRAQQSKITQRTPDKIQLTTKGHTELQAELDSLISQRPDIAEEIRKAALDKDFRENAPLHAAKEKQGHIESRIREIESTLKNSVVTDNTKKSTVQLGHTILIRNLSSNSKLKYTIVGPAEANTSQGKISSASPVGQALLEQREGTEVKVIAPKGTLHFRIEKISS